MITHRCKGSLKAEVSIRYGQRWENMFSPEEKQAWRMITYGLDDEYFETFVKTSSTEIKYCPFCGQKLEAPEGETSDER